jgi:hypothetical protein
MLMRSLYKPLDLPIHDPPVYPRIVLTTHYHCASASLVQRAFRMLPCGP